MTGMRRLAITGLTLVLLTALTAVIGEALHFRGTAYLGALFVVMFLVSLTDRDRFYARDLRPDR
jgi:hypothetical protein